MLPIAFFIFEKEKERKVKMKESKRNGEMCSYPKVDCNYKGWETAESSTESLERHIHVIFRVCIALKSTFSKSQM